MVVGMQEGNMGDGEGEGGHEGVGEEEEGRPVTVEKEVVGKV